jgi:YjbE family integral membrane protein
MNEWPQIAALGQILLIDITLAGDNAVVVGLAAATVPKDKRRLVIVGGIGVAVLLRLGLASMARQLLTIVGLTLSGGILLLWVAWKLFRQIRHQAAEAESSRKHQGVARAIVQVAIADLSMSLDNVLAVAGAANGHPAWVLAGGLGLAVILMAFASSLVARLLHRLPWISYAGLAVVVFVAGRMIWLGSGEVMRAWFGA